MLVDIEKGALEGIVKDGIKEMMNKIENKNRNAKKRKWLLAVKKAVQEYQQRIEEEFLPVLVKDFGSKLEVKFRDGRMSEEDIGKIKEFMKSVEKSSIKNILEELKAKIAEIEAADVELKKKLEAIKQVVVEGHQWIFSRVEAHVRGVISDAVYKKSVKRSKMEVMLYSFVDGEVPDSVKDLFKNGMDSVPSCKLSKKEIEDRVEDALLEFLMRLGRRRFYGYCVVQTNSVEGWMRKVKSMRLGNEADKFVGDLENSLPGLRAELDLVYKDVEIESKEKLTRDLEQKDWVLVMCDKNMGMSLFTLETMRKADENLMEQLGAIKMINKTKEEIVETVVMEIKQFEKDLTLEQQEYMNSAFGSRCISMGTVSFPFLKSLHKIHKMSEDEINNKNLSVLKFRPVVDAKSWLTKGYAEVAMQMMREANSLLVMQSGPVMEKMKPKNGWIFAVYNREYKVEEEFDVVVQADIEVAYTNISDTMIKRDIGIVSRFVGFEEWKINLMKKLVDLVLDQNFAETSGGLYKFKKVLPMGYKLSGEALDIVALAEEMMILFHLGGDLEKRMKIGELKNYPVDLVDNNVDRELSMSKGVKSFSRYVDDVHSNISGTKEDILHGILAVGYMYPETLVISMELNI